MAKNIFAQEPMRKTRTNRFDLSNTVNTSTKFGRITPTMVREVLPGDHFNIRSENLIRFQSLLAPVMHNVKAYTHFFFVPNRILWENWEDFITGGRLGNAAPPIPRQSQVAVPNGYTFSEGSLGDYLGFPVGVPVKKDDFNMLPFAAYQKIYYDYYIDRNLDATEFRPLSDGDTNQMGAGHLYGEIRKRAWRKDYFTSALPWAQRGSPVNLPLGDEAPVFSKTDNDAFEIDWAANEEGNNVDVIVPNRKFGSQSPGIKALYTDLSEATSATVNDLRRTMRLQEFFEKLARGGSRYFEVLRSFFGSRNLDSRLDRAEYIGGNIQPVVISEVLQTSATESGSTPLAEMAGHGVSVSSGKTSKYTCHEHGFIIGLTTLMPEAIYTQGLPRQYSRSDRFDYYWSSFAHIGEQEILNKELYYDSDPLNDDTFGYTPRYSEYRYNPNISTGAMRSTLDYWTFARRFDNRPLLNNQFVQMDGDQDYFANAFAGGATEDYIIMQIRNHVKARRAVARHGVPTI